MKTTFNFTEMWREYEQRQRFKGEFAVYVSHLAFMNFFLCVSVVQYIIYQKNIQYVMSLFVFISFVNSVLFVLTVGPYSAQYTEIYCYMAFHHLHFSYRFVAFYTLTLHLLNISVLFLIILFMASRCFLFLQICLHCSILYKKRFY